MFSRYLNKIRGRINLRLAALYSIVFILSSMLLFGLIYLFLSSTLKKDDFNSIRYKLLELWASYETGGVQAINRQVSLGKLLGERRVSMVRVADSWNNTLLLIIPETWRSAPEGSLQRIYSGEEGTKIKIEAGGTVYHIETASLLLSDGNRLQVGMNVAERVFVLKRFREIFAVVMVPFILISFLGGAYLAARSLRPLRSLNETVRTIIETKKFEARIPSPGTRDEMEELVLLFNRMLGMIEPLVEGMRNALDNVAHDLRTPLARMRGSAEAALQSPGDHDQLKQAVVESMEEADVMLSLLNTLMDISEAETGVMHLDRKPVDLSMLVDDMAELYRYIAEEKEIEVSTDLPKELSVSADVTRIRQALANLLENAIKYSPSHGEITVRLSSDGTDATVLVKDRGTGIAEEEIERVWERHYRGKNAKGSPGLGLGLSFVKAVVEAHGGTVRVTSTQKEGSEFSFTLPLSD
jgi:signal transduction histidine kinase